MIEVLPLPTWISRYIDSNIKSQHSRYTRRHITHAHVALIFRGRKLLAIGQNRPVCHGTHQNTIHAEVAAIRSLGDISQLRGATLVVVRLSPAGEIRGSKPCSSCQCVLDKCMREYGLRSYLHS
jgi:hypothetical protein